MMRLTIAGATAGMHPSEQLVTITTRDGREELFVDGSQIEQDSIPVGFPVGRSNGHVLVELPRETMRGNWRVWVDLKQLTEM
ncbi:MAG: hypothetical protein P4L82_20995 [Ancalomicrobiaceae bacterium]|nr:hypothetical protein [Ancalomicrobiaceae bacterium]